LTGLAFTRLTLSHFRSYKHAQLEHDARPIAFYGSNGAGKTNLLEAVSMLSPGRGIRRAGADELIRSPERLGWKITAELDSMGFQHELETSATPGVSRQVQVDGKAASQLVLGKLSRMVWLVPSMDRIWLDGAEGRRRFLDRMTLSFTPSHGEISLAYDKAMRERNRLLKDRATDENWYRALERQMAQSGVTLTKNRRHALRRLADAQADGATAFPTAQLTLLDRCDGGLPETVDDLQGVLAKNRGRDLAAGRSLIGPHRADLAAVYAAKQVDARLCSTGEQKALLISLILANARAIASDFGAAPIVLLDEVAAHLDVDRRAALYDEICALKAQAWMTGTDASLFDALGDRARLIEVRETANGSELTEGGRL